MRSGHTKYVSNARNRPGRSPRRTSLRQVETQCIAHCPHYSLIHSRDQRDIAQTHPCSNFRMPRTARCTVGMLQVSDAIAYMSSSMLAQTFGEQAIKGLDKPRRDRRATESRRRADTSPTTCPDSVLPWTHLLCSIRCPMIASNEKTKT